MGGLWLVASVTLPRPWNKPPGGDQFPLRIRAQGPITTAAKLSRNHPAHRFDPPWGCQTLYTDIRSFRECRGNSKTCSPILDSIQCRDFNRFQQGFRVSFSDEERRTGSRIGGDWSGKWTASVPSRRTGTRIRPAWTPVSQLPGPPDSEWPADLVQYFIIPRGHRA